MSEGLGRVVAALRACGIDAMLAGSHASGFHGVPRTTQDFDLVIDPDEATLTRLVERLTSDDFSVDEPAALDALRHRSMFNVIDNVTGWKTDFVILPRDEFSRSQWERRESATVWDVEIAVASAEDTILAKLVWARRGGGSERQLRDVAGVLAVQADRLDRAYIERWIARLGVDELWRRVAASG